MSVHHSLTNEEPSILAFADADFKKRSMNLALAMVQNPDINLIELRTVISVYRNR